MALLKAKALRKFKYEGKSYDAGDELVINRKASLEFVESGHIETFGNPLDPQNPEDKPLIDEWNADHAPQEEKPKKSKK